VLGAPYVAQGLREVAERMISVFVTPVAVASRGSVTLRSADPRWKPVIDPAYLSDPADLEIMLAGVRQAREIAATGPLAKLGGGEAAPGEGSDLTDWIRHELVTLYHPTSTCAMGGTDDAVCDPELRVRGVDGLRVVDASVMPSVPRGNTNAPVIAIAERAADLIIGGHMLPAVDPAVRQPEAPEVRPAATVLADASSSTMPVRPVGEAEEPAVSPAEPTRPITPVGKPGAEPADEPREEPAARPSPAWDAVESGGTREFEAVDDTVSPSEETQQVRPILDPESPAEQTRRDVPLPESPVEETQRIPPLDEPDGHEPDAHEPPAAETQRITPIEEPEDSAGPESPAAETQRLPIVEDPAPLSKAEKTRELPPVEDPEAGNDRK
jgi:hypothetical protein